MLLVHPVLEPMKFFPFLIGIFVLGSTGDDNWWQFIGVGIPIAVGVMRFLTTTYRITPTQVELQRGLIGKSVLTARLDRVRAVELTSSPIHRILGLAKVEIGTASGGKQDDDKFALDSLPVAEAREMRVALLHRVDTRTAPEDGCRRGASQDDTVLVRLDPRWVRFAPLTSSGNVIAAGLLAVFGQFADRAHIGIDEQQAEDLVTGISVVLVVVLVPLAFIVLGAVFAVLGYLISNWGFTLSRDARGRSFHVRRGLLTTTETSLERERVRGLELGEQLGLRLAGAGRLSAVVTGISKDERSSTQLVPPAPIAVVREVGAEILEDASPIHLTLQQHGPAAQRRRYTRALVGASVLPVLALVLVLTTPLPWWVVLPTLLTIPPGCCWPPTATAGSATGSPTATSSSAPGPFVGDATCCSARASSAGTSSSRGSSVGPGWSRWWRPPPRASRPTPPTTSPRRWPSRSPTRPSRDSSAPSSPDSCLLLVVLQWLCEHKQ